MDTEVQTPVRRLGTFRREDFAALTLRVVIGMVFIAHGVEKLSATVGGGLDAWAGYMSASGLKPGLFFAALAGILELGSGLLFLAGVLTPVAAVTTVGIMTVAIAVQTGRNGFFIFNGGYEFNVCLIGIALSLVITGPGRLRFGHRLGRGRFVGNFFGRSWRRYG